MCFCLSLCLCSCLSLCLCCCLSLCLCSCLPLCVWYTTLTRPYKRLNKELWCILCTVKYHCLITARLLLHSASPPRPTGWPSTAPAVPQPSSLTVNFKRTKKMISLCNRTSMYVCTRTKLYINNSYPDSDSKVCKP